MARQTTFSDIGDAIYDSRAFSRFMGLSFDLGDQAPDATTLLRFRCIIESKDLAPQIPAYVNGVLEANGVMMRGGSIVDATFVEAPSSTKNAKRKRDPEMHQGKKGNNRIYGIYVGRRPRSGPSACPHFSDFAIYAGRRLSHGPRRAHAFCESPAPRWLARARSGQGTARSRG